MARKMMVHTVIAVFLVGVMPNGRATDPTQEQLPASIQDIHRNLSKQLSPDQMKALSTVYPDFRLLKLCSARFSGVDRSELVLGVWKPVESADWWKREVHRVGLIWDRSKWVVHIIDNEIEKDADLSHSSPLSWQYTISNRGFTGNMKCGVELGKDPDLSDALRDKPFFELKEKGLQRNTPVCFATSDVYNNWDCVVYSPNDRRFRLWYQQAHAD